MDKKQNIQLSFMDQIMKNKFFLLSALLGLATTSAVSANYSANEGCYVSVFGGPNWVNQNHRRHVEVDFKTGYLVGASIGYQWCNNISVEGEFTYRHNKLDKIKFSRNKCRDEQRQWHNFRRDRDLESYAVMANVRYDWALECMCFMPYIRAGIGYGNTKFRTRHDDYDCYNNLLRCRHNHHRSAFAYQAGAGITIPDIMCNTHLDIGYNYWSTTQRRGRSNLGNNSLVVAAKYVF
ncbi:MAG: porin family protein [Parachlamydiaceae bacterium]|nr:porin family protein [Parachlamydiaceae bacterium]